MPDGSAGVSIDVTDETRRREFDSLLHDIAVDLISRAFDTLDAAVGAALQRCAAFLGANAAALYQVSADARVRLTHWWIDGALGHDRPPFADETSITRTLGDQLANGGTVTIARPDDRVFRSLVLVEGPKSNSVRNVVLLSRASDAANWPKDTVPTLRAASALLSAVSTRHQAEEDQRIDEQRAQEAQKLESLGVLAGGIAHDFNNLLTSILGHASLMRAEQPAHPLGGDSLEQIEIAARRAAALCRQMLAYAGRGPISLQHVDLSELVKEARALLELGLPPKTRLVLNLARGLPHVLADDGNLRQVVTNLVVNAVEAIGDHEGTITITTDVVTRTPEQLAETVFSPQLEGGRYVRLTVADTGAGMTPETISRIFDPFFTTKFTGRGLGLAAVLGIVRAHRSALRVESTPRVGSTFELLFSAEVHAPVPIVGPEPPDDAALTKWRTTGHVLVADDEPAVRSLMASILQRIGLTVLQAEDGRAAIDIVRSSAADIRLAIIDLTMPELNGREALAGIHTIRPDLPAILMSGYVPGDAIGSPHLFLEKPFTPAGVRKAVWMALSGT